MLYLFDKNEKLIHELASNEMESLIQHEELNKLMTLEFAVFIDSNDKMKNIEYVAHKDMENYQQIQMYRVISSESDDYTVNYQAVHIIFDELKAYGYIRDKRPDKAKASFALDVALAGSRWKVGRVDDSDLLSASFYDLTRLDALSKIIKTWNLDLRFYLTFDGNKITGRYIDLLSFRGEDTGERFVYGSNALEVVKEVDKSEVYTRVIPRGKGEEKHDENGKPTDGYGRRIKIDDVIWDKSKGNPIDKPKGQEYLELTEMTRKFGFSDGEPRTRVQIFDDIEDPKELIKAGYDFLVQVSRPLVQFKTKISKRSRTNVGDVVRIIRKDLDFYYRTRIYKAHRNLLNETLEVEFGDKLVQSPADREKIVSDSLNSLEERIKETETDLKSSFVDKVNEGITHATFNRDGYNYELKKGNKYGLPAGYYSFDREIDDNPQRVIYVGAGTLAIADSKKSNGDWNFRTFGTGQGFVADLLVAGTILGGKVRWNLEDGTLLIGNNPDDYNLYWDGETLHFRNVDIDLKNSKDFSEIKDDIDKKISKEDVLEDKEIQEALRGKDGAKGVPGLDGKDGHTLTAEVWMEGEFRNHLTKDVNVYRKATYDGVEIEITDSNSEIFRDGGDGVWVRDGIGHTAWGNWDNRNNYLAEKFTIMYKGLKASSFARLDNVNDGEKGSPGKDGVDGKTGKIGQNILRNSNVPVSNKDYPTNTWTLCETPTTGETMTFTAKIKLEKDDKIGLYNSGGMIDLNWWTDVSKSQDYVIYSYTFNWKDTYEYNGKIYEQTSPPTLLFYTHSNGNGDNKNQNEVSIEWATLTRGDIPAIEWSPCYADVDDAIKVGKEESEEISRKLIKVESDFKIDSNNIKASVSSLSETTERSFVNLKKDMADADVKVETGIKNYIVNNYTTKTQTQNAIEVKVGEFKRNFDDSLSIMDQENSARDRVVQNLQADLSIQADKIESKVSKDGFGSLVKQEFDKYTVQARNINFDGSYVNVKGSFRTIGGDNDVGIKIDYNDIVFRDYRGNGTNYGSITVVEDKDSNNDMSLNIGHFKTGHVAIRYWVPEERLWRPYVAFDKWYYTNRISGYPITFYEGVDFRGVVHMPEQINFNSVRIRTYSDSIGIESFDGKAGLVIKSDGSVYIKDAKGSRRLYVRE